MFRTRIVLIAASGVALAEWMIALPAAAQDPGPMHGAHRPPARGEGVFDVIAEGRRGSGWLADEAGLIVTSYAVVRGSAYLAVAVGEGDKYSARLIVDDEANDIAVLRVHPSAVRGHVPLRMATAAAGHGSGAGMHAGAGTGVADSGWSRSDPSGAVVGIPSGRAPSAPRVVPARVMAAVLERAREALNGPPPAAQKLPAPGKIAFPMESLGAAADPAIRAGDYRMRAGKFAVGFMTPVLIAGLEAASARDPRGTPGPRPARSNPGPGFRGWQAYAGDLRAVVTIRAVPELADRPRSASAGNRGAESTFGADFHSMELLLEGFVIHPLHPGRLELADRAGAASTAGETGHYGAYEYPPEAFRPGTQLTLRIREQGDDRGTEHRIPPRIVERLWQDFQPYFREVRRAIPEHAH